MARAYDAVVYDLDGTLVRLAVDWEAAERDVAGVLRARGIDVAGRTLWDMLELADERGVREPVSAALEDHERTGARRAERLPLADELPRSEPVGVCSLNAESACRIALELHGLDAHVDTLVGRDTVATYKPDPAPLQHILDRLGVEPSRALFVGDSDRDREAARRAGLAFEWVRDRQP